MIRSKHPEWPGTIHRDDLQYIGYWRTNDRFIELDDYPDPLDFVDEEWDEIERKMVFVYLNTAGTVLYPWLGTSTCRICGIRPCTSLRELLLQEFVEKKYSAFCLTDGVFAWPSGLAHYVKEHAVRPPQAFIDHIMQSREG